MQIPTYGPDTRRCTLPEKAWKRYERVILELAGWRRIPVSGRTGSGQDPGDGEAPGFHVEVRDRTDPRPVRWFRETVQEAKTRGGIPLLIFKGPTPALSPLVILRWRDLVEVMRGGGSPEGPRSAARGEAGAAGAYASPDPRRRPGPRGGTTPPAAGDEGGGPGDGPGR